MRTSLSRAGVQPWGIVQCRRAGSQHGSDVRLPVCETNRQNSGVLFILTLYLIKIAKKQKKSGGVSPIIMSLFCCCFAERSEAVCSLDADPNRRKRGLCICAVLHDSLTGGASVWWVLVRAPPSLSSSWTRHRYESDESFPVTVAHMGAGCQGNCQQGPRTNPPPPSGRCDLNPIRRQLSCHTRPSWK